MIVCTRLLVFCASSVLRIYYDHDIDSLSNLCPWCEYAN